MYQLWNKQTKSVLIYFTCKKWIRTLGVSRLESCSFISRNALFKTILIIKTVVKIPIKYYVLFMPWSLKGATKAPGKTRKTCCVYRPVNGCLWWKKTEKNDDDFNQQTVWEVSISEGKIHSTSAWMN